LEEKLEKPSVQIRGSRETRKKRNLVVTEVTREKKKRVHSRRRIRNSIKAWKFFLQLGRKRGVTLKKDCRKREGLRNFRYEVKKTILLTFII